MKKNIQIPQPIKSISDLHQFFGIPQPTHPQISVIDLKLLKNFSVNQYPVIYHFYCIAIKNNFEGKLRYGNDYYEFDEGVMTFISPSQVLHILENDSKDLQGHMLVLDRDFLRGYPLAQRIKKFDFFSYQINKALALTEKEQQFITKLILNLGKEIKTELNAVTHDLLVSHTELLLNYCNRFYSRQFSSNNLSKIDILTQFDQVLEAYINSEQIKIHGIPSVPFIAKQLHFSPNYLSDLLRRYTGKSTRNHIQDKIIDKAKDILLSTNLSISEVAFMLGFEYPQSFNKLFKNKTKLSPAKFRASLL